MRTVNRVPASSDTIIFFLLVLSTGRVERGRTQNICSQKRLNRRYSTVFIIDSKERADLKVTA